MTGAFTRILVGTDGSGTAATAVDLAIEMAVGLKSQLVLVSAYEPSAPALAVPQTSAPAPAVPQPSAGLEDESWALGPRAEALAVLERASEAARSAGIAGVLTFGRQGDPAEAILAVAEEQGCDLIVVGNQGMKGARRFLLGSVPNKVSHHAPCSVLIVRTS